MLERENLSLGSTLKLGFEFGFLNLQTRRTGQPGALEPGNLQLVFGLGLAPGAWEQRLEKLGYYILTLNAEKD